MILSLAIPIKVTALEKRQRDFENSSLAGFEVKRSATLRCRTDL
jgi:hypothetical protein